MSNFMFYVIASMFKLKSTLKQELGNEMSRQVVDKTKYYYKELDKSKPKEKSVWTNIGTPQSPLTEGGGWGLPGGRETPF